LAVRAFACGHCHQLVFFENSVCLRCGTPLGFVPSRRHVVALTGDATASMRRCANADIAACNWMVEGGDPEALCRCCRLTRTRPNDNDPIGLAAFTAAETAKRRLVFQLLELGLPLDEGLSFDLLTRGAGPVTTGHRNGLITIDLAESDDAHREQMRSQLGEPYRTMLGHFRHEIGHHYWPFLVSGPGRIGEWRDVFGDERTDYDEALRRHYDIGPPADWSEHHVSAYASAHPWEDWAETFAHYLHIADTLQTAASFGLIVAGPGPRLDYSLISAPSADLVSFETMIGDWLPLTYALNAVNRSMGKDDLYPFVLAPAVIAKLGFVHACLQHGREPVGGAVG
jgi:hypothetical protein